MRSIYNLYRTHAMSGTQMKYPYSLAAKIRRFPFHHYMFVAKNGWVLRYWTISTILCLPLFYKFHKMSHAPENVKKWEELHKEQFSGKMHH
ncbi:uncharacterized protein LOC122567588 isoform X1 [Bombus pyrosoma]|uniref:uncharacterized protein LOC122567588 isoform X1 n=2 Tax=Bombus pyrosoma TaxID=396416 RepID=UPI001CB9A11E|nr:uncharacterized protein LOC122567588 isoform X1 [Bombus pyrosoma]